MCQRHDVTIRKCSPVLAEKPIYATHAAIRSFCDASWKEVSGKISVVMAHCVQEDKKLDMYIRRLIIRHNIRLLTQCFLSNESIDCGE